MLNEPEGLPFWLSPIWGAYKILSDGRSHGFNGGNPITLADMVTYHAAFDAPCPLPRFVRLLQAMDSVFMAWQEKENAARKS